jgi:competence ComEA-like helix-hairpin-helix protein
MTGRTLGWLAATGLAALAVSLSFGAQDPEGSADLPEGPGKTAVMRLCAKCHGLEQFTAARHSKEEWDVLIDKMSEEGLEMSDQDYETVIGYLTKYLGKDAPPLKIRINTLTVAMLEERLGLSDKAAEAIVKHRTEHGPFKTWQDVAKVPGVEAKKIEAVKDLLQF